MSRGSLVGKTRGASTGTCARPVPACAGICRPHVGALVHLACCAPWPHAVTQRCSAPCTPTHTQNISAG
jgi:hypothetical protein